MKYKFLEKENRMMFFGILSILFMVSFYIFYMQVFYFRFYNIPKSDLSDHIKLIELILQHKYHVPHAGFHYSTYFFSLMTFLNREYSAILLLSSFVVISFIVTFYTLKVFLTELYPERFIIFITLFLHLVTPVFLPVLNTTIFFGQGSPNIWHSPTFIMTKPFVLIIIILIVSLLEDLKKQTSIRYIILPSFLLMLSVFYKPNFALAFIPAVGLYILFKHWSEFRKYVISFFLVLPALLILGYQFISTYFFTDNNLGGTGDHIILTFFGAWKVHSPCIPLSVLRGIIFPASIFLFRRKEVIKNNYLILSWLFYLAAFAEVSFLAEKEGFFAFNFSNGYSFALISLYTFSVIELLKWMKEFSFPFNIYGLKYCLLSVENKKMYITTILFYSYIISGFIYLVRQALGYGFS
jgi:hypothetical protein